MSAQLRRLAPQLLRRAAPFATKSSTGIVGLPVVPNGREVLMALSAKILKMAAALPEQAQYRRTLESVYGARLDACRAHTEAEAIEAQVGQGQIEELIRMAQDEEKLLPKMAEWKPWEVPEGHTIPMEVDEDKFIPPKQNY